MKGYELIQKIANREIKENSKIQVSFNETLIDIIIYKNKRLNWNQNGNFNTEYLCSNSVKFELVEENKEIEELWANTIGDSEQCRDKFALDNRDKINELVRAVNKLIKESEEK